MIIVENKRKKLETLQKAYPNASIIDVTSHGEQSWIKFSPFYPHANIPVPLSPGYTAASVEGIWQGLKLFESVGIDLTKFNISTMKNIKRTTRQLGRVLGHQAGVESTALLTYLEARQQIYLPAYDWVLDNVLSTELKELWRLSRQQPMVLLDYETNTDITNLTKPLSHAGLIKRYIDQHFDL